MSSSISAVSVGAKNDFEIWMVKVFLSLDQEKSPEGGLQVATPENLEWKNT